MSNQSSGCFGCLGTLFSLTLIGSVAFGVTSIAVKVGNYVFGFGSTVNLLKQGKSVSDLNDLQSKTKATEQWVKQFHTQLEQGKCQEIYKQANEVFKQATRQSDFLNFCEKMRRELGTIKSAQLLDSWGRPANQDSDKYILSRYYTSFSNFSAQETFVWLVKNSKPELIQYQINPVIPRHNDGIKPLHHLAPTSPQQL
jgi:hypothetical protein